MSKGVWVRFWFKSKEEVIIKRKKWLWPRNWDMSYYDFASTQSERNRCESEVVTAIQVLRKKLIAMVEADVAHSEDMKSANEMTGNSRFGVSTPRLVSEKDLKQYDTYHAKPDEEIWRAAINPKWLSSLGIKPKARKTSSDNSPPSRGNSQTYTTADKKTTSEHGYEFSSDGGVEVFEEKQGNSANKGEMKEWKKAWRKETPFDGEEHGSNKAYEAIVQEEWENHCH